MGDIAKGVLGGAWAMLVGWIMPSGVNLAIFWLIIAPELRHVSSVARMRLASGTSASVTLLVGSILAGLILHALQNTLYRILEGYMLWPRRLYQYGCARQLQVKRNLRDRAAFMRLERREQDGSLRPEGAEQLAQLRANSRTAQLANRDRARTAAQRAILQEKLARYPVNDEQVAPTRLGNAIRRLEEYGYDRYRLDTQVIWHELTGAAPDSTRRQVELTRTRVDFFVALLYGHGAVALSGLVVLSASTHPAVHLALAAACLTGLIPLWYRAAVSATDEWAAAVRALVNLGRKPLAESLGFSLPVTVAEERAMWTLVCRLSRLPYHERAASLDQYRAQPPA
ncbi:hypothetical protein [Streptomyces longisporus]|uniref:Uncharacterized protein n=1 Tax=Streptomyces longisporus TaxID=1948 RepID=A0ABN3KXV9_STRLO